MALWMAALVGSDPGVFWMAPLCGPPVAESGGPIHSGRSDLNIELEQHDVAIDDDVALAFHAVEAFLSR